jgi:hypothetical protein
MEVLERHKRVLRRENPDTLTSMANLASTYRNQGRWKEAEDLEVQVMETVGTRCTLVHCSLYTGCIYRGLPRIS